MKLYYGRKLLASLLYVIMLCICLPFYLYDSALPGG